MDDLKQTIKAEAEKLGFCFCGFTDSSPCEDHSRYLDWLKKDAVGTMTFLKREDHIQKRLDPQLVFPEVRTICVLGIPYRLAESDAIASYAYYRDYHERIPFLADELMKTVSAAAGREIHYRVCTDSAPLLERSLAVRAGLGWIGKSSMLIHPEYGSSVLLCEILMDLELLPDAPFTKEHCGDCRRCADACPGRCIDPETRTILADHCVSYLTIEHKGEFDPEQSETAANSLFGCDICLKVCPWNRRNHSGPDSPLEPADEIPSAADLGISDGEFREKYRGSAFFRSKNSGLQRNLINYLKHKRG